MFKLTSVVLISLALTFSAGAKVQNLEEVPNLRLTLSIENTTWTKYEPVLVKITIENLSGNKVELPSSISFNLDNRTFASERVTMDNGVFWSPVSLTKTYGKDVAGCQSDLVENRVEVLKGTNIVSISPPKDSLMLTTGEKKEFSFDLTKTCWNHSISSVYPNSNLFSLVDTTPAAKHIGSNKYRVYFDMEFKAGTVDGIPRNKRPRSNEVEIVVN
jgi:hypothetical protein